MDLDRWVVLSCLERGRVGFNFGDLVFGCDFWCDGHGGGWLGVWVELVRR